MLFVRYRPAEGMAFSDFFTKVAASRAGAISVDGLSAGPYHRPASITPGYHLVVPNRPACKR
jgi:hypothetical protein